MVAIIDDREDVWGRCPNLVHVKPYVFFSGTSDINAPPPLVSASESPSAPSSSLPSTPTTPRPFFGGTAEGSGVVPQGQPRPFKKRHMLRQHRLPQRPPRPQSELASQSRSAESRNNGTPDQLHEQQEPSPVENRQETQETGNVADDVNVYSTNNNGLTVPNLHQEQIATHCSNVNNNNNKRKSGDDGTESGGSASGEEEDGEGSGGGNEEEGGGGTPDQVEGEGDTPGRGEGEGESGGKRSKGGGKGNESSSSSSGSSSDSEDSSSSGSSSAMDDTVPQEPKAESEVKRGVDTEIPMSAEEGKEEQSEYPYKMKFYTHVRVYCTCVYVHMYMYICHN